MVFSTQDKPFFPVDLTDKLKEVRRMGFDQYETDGALVLHHFDELRAASAKSGVPISTICGGYRGWIGDFDEDKRIQGVRDITAILERGSGIGIVGIVVPAAWAMCTLRLPPHSAPRNKEDDRAALLRSLTELDKVAIRTGTWIYLEPLNRYEDHMVNTQAEAAEIIAEGCYEKVKTTADLYHMNIEEKDVAGSMRQYASQIGHIHICDSNRSEPGEGHIDFKSVFSTLKQCGYNGILAFEGRVTGEPAAESYEKSLAYVKSCWENA